MSTRRRTYSLLGGWLMSGEVLYCGSPTVSKTDYDLMDMNKDYYLKILVSNDVINQYSDYIYVIFISDSGSDIDEDSLMTNYSGLSNLSTFIGSGTDSVKLRYEPYYGGITISRHVDSSSSMNYNSVLILAIPRTDI